jgi:cyclic pyranopterin phosphate synthase
MVPISSKSITSRTAVAVCTIQFSTPTATPLIRANQLKKGDVLGVARIAGIMAAKKTSDLIPLCHPLGITHVSVDLDVVGGVEGVGEVEVKENERGRSEAWQGTGQGDVYPFHPKEKQISAFGKVDITATVSCDGKTGVEMEALTAASTAALTVYDMCKAVDKGMRIEGLRVVRKEGGKSGLWVEGQKALDET